jgi:hypothetical protein
MALQATGQPTLLAVNLIDAVEKDHESTKRTASPRFFSSLLSSPSNELEAMEKLGNNCPMGWYSSGSSCLTND